jgi:hypothetical protein
VAGWACEKGWEEVTADVDYPWGCDTAVDVKDSKRFVEKCRKMMGQEVEVKLALSEGMEHGF